MLMWALLLIFNVFLVGDVNSFVKHGNNRCGLTLRGNSNCDLWIVGAGTMGLEVSKQWIKAFSQAKVVAETATAERHQSLKESGAQPQLRINRNENDSKSARNVLICLPPSVTDYIGEVRQAVELWNDSDDGCLLLTSTVGIYDAFTADRTFTEATAIDRNDGKTIVLAYAEKVVRNKGGSVVRLAGLYNLLRGPHSAWLKKAVEGIRVESSPSRKLNLLHYEDAADIAVNIMSKGIRNGVFLASGDEPATRQDICDATLSSYHYRGSVAPRFPDPTEFSDPSGSFKPVDCSVTKATLGWAPKYPSFVRFIRNS